MVTGTNSDFVGHYNRRVVLNLLRKNEPVSRTEAARQTGLSLQATSTIFSELRAEGWISSRGRRISSRGQPPVDYGLNAEKFCSIGVVVDLDGISCLVGNLSGTILIEKKQLLQRFAPAEAVDVIVSMVQELLSQTEISKDRIIGLGVAIPGTPNPITEQIIALPHMKGWEGFPLREVLSKQFDFPVFVANDAIVTALGESWFGSSKYAKDFFYVFFAHGLNGALVSDQQPYGGIWGITGKFGHIPVEQHGEICPGCGGRGCLEQYASRLALGRALNVEEPTEKLLTKLFAERDVNLLSWLKDATNYLAAAILSVENLFDPELIVFGGSMPLSILEAMLDQLQHALPPRRMIIKPHHPTLVISNLSENAASIGALTLPFHQAITPNIELTFQSLERR